MSARSEQALRELAERHDILDRSRGRLEREIRAGDLGARHRLAEVLAEMDRIEDEMGPSLGRVVEASLARRREVL